MNLPVALISSSIADAVLSATLMLTIVGMVAAVVLSRLSVQSWRLQSLLIAAVLLQGVMLVRTPIHLGWIEKPKTTGVEAALAEFDAQFATISASAAENSIPVAEQNTKQVFPPAIDQAKSTLPMVDVSWKSVFWSVWLLGLVMLTSLALHAYVRVIRAARKLDAAPRAWRREWVSVAGKQADRCEMFVSSSVGPLMLRRPSGYAFIVPESYWSGLNWQQRHGVMLHELAHLQRHDVWRQFLVRIVATVHWFNPVAWWAMRRYEQATELACDQRVTEAGEHVSAGFASALVQLIQWHEQSGLEVPVHRGFGLQTMAAPPLTSRVSRLLKPNSIGDSMMKRVVLALLALAIAGVSFVQIRLTAADGDSTDSDNTNLSVLSESVDDRLAEVISQLDQSDQTTSRFASLADSTSGRLAIGGYLNTLRNREMESARADAVPRFMARYFTKSDGGKYQTRSDQQAAYVRWEKKSQRLGDAFDKLAASMTDIAANLSEEGDANMLMKRLMNDPQGPAAAMLFDKRAGGDVITQYISKAMGSFLVDRGDGSFQIVDSKRGEAEQQIGKLEMASKIHTKLLRELPLLADELDTGDAQHQKFAKYLKNPMMASVVSVVLLKEHRGNPSMAVEELFTNLEKASVDTAGGLKIQEPALWQKLDEIYGQVDRLGGLIPRVQERLTEVGETLSKDDPLAQRLATQMNKTPIAVLLAAELPYADADPGEMLRGQLSEILEETADGKMSVREDKQEEVAGKMQEWLRICRAIRRHSRTIDDVLDSIEDKELIDRLGDAGRYFLLNEIRQTGESVRPDPIALLQKDLLAATDSNKYRVREERREVVRQLLEQAEKVDQQEANDDF